MSSDTDDDSKSLQDRLTAKLIKAGIKCKDSSIGIKDNTKTTNSTSSVQDDSTAVLKLKTVPALKKEVKQDLGDDSSGSEDEDIRVKRKSHVMEISSSESEPDRSISFSPQQIRRPKSNVLKSSDESSSQSSSEDSSEESQASSDGEFIEKEADEVSDTESGTPDEEGVGDLVESSESDWESDWQSDTEEQPVKCLSSYKEVPCVGSQAASSGFASDSSDGTSEKCPICLLRFTDQDIGTPESCDHSFCAECLQQWSKNVNTCPVDRQEFTLIHVRRRVGGKIINRIPVERQEPQEENAADDLTYCEICGHSDREDCMLLCDGCDLGFHMDCLDPPLHHVPMEDWFCFDCTQSNAVHITAEVGVQNADAEDARTLGISANRTRLLPRTQQLERIRRVVRDIIERRRIDNLTQPSTSSGIDSQQSGEGRPKHRKMTKKKTKSKTKRKAKKVSRKKTSGKSIKKKITRSKKSLGKKRKKKQRTSCKVKRKKRSSRQCLRTARFVAPQSVKGRLAEQLGMCPPRQPWQTIPDIKSSSNKSGIGLDRSRAGIPTLHIFGQRDQLDYFSGSDEEFGSGGGIAAVHQPRSTLTLEQRMLNRKRLLVTLSNPCLPHRPLIDEPAVNGTTVDLVDSILKSQAKMLSKKTDVRINIDGSLDIKLKDPIIPKPENASQQLPDSATGRVVQAPMYPGAGNRRGGPGMYHHSYNEGNNRGGTRGRGGVSNSGGGGSNFNTSGFRSSFHNPENSRAQYEQYLGSSLPSGHSSNRPRPLSFRLNVTRRPLRRNAIMRRGIPPVEDEAEEGVEEEIEIGSQPVSKESEESAEGPKEDDDVDIYSDIEADSRKGASEADEPPFGALLPPPEPPAILMNLGEQNSDDEASDSDLVIDDHAKGPADETEDKYDPAEPCDDSDDERVCVPQAEEIPLPPGPGPMKSPPVAPVVEECSEESKSQEAIIEKNEEDHVSSTSVGIAESTAKEKSNKSEVEVLCSERVELEHDSTAKTDVVADDSSEEDDDDCPNFSIYSAASVSIARQVGEVELETRSENVEKKTLENEDMASNDKECSDSADTNVIQNEEAVPKEAHIEDSVKKSAEEGLLEVDIENSEKKALEDSAKDKDESEGKDKEDKDESEGKDKDDPEDDDDSLDSGSDDAGEVQKGQEQMLEEIFGLDDDSLVAAPTVLPSAPVVPGLEGLETEIISDGEEAMLDGDLSDSEIMPEEKRIKKRPQKTSGIDKEKAGDPIEFEDGEIVDEAQRERRERKEKEKREKQKTSEGNENINTSKSKEASDDDKRKKKKREHSPKSSKDRAPLSSSENRTKERDKEKGKDKDKEKDKRKVSDSDREKNKGKDDISWKKPSKSTKDRNYRDGKEKGKDDKKDDDRESSRKDRKKKEKRKDLERYDVRKVLSDKTLSRQNKDAFGRDLDIRRRTHTRSRSKSRTRSRSRARSARGRSRSRSYRRAARSRSRGRSPGRSRLRYRSASRGRSRSRRSQSRSRFRSGNRSRSRHRSIARSRDRHRKSRSKDRARKRSREQRNGSVNRQRNRSTTASRERRREARDREQPIPRSSWSRSWSRSWSPSLSGSPQYPASETLAGRSFSRSWSRDRVDHVSTTDMVGGKHKTHKNLTVIVTNNKEESRRKRKDGKRGNKRRGSPAPSKEVFASGDNILVSVNFKSDKSGAQTSNTLAGEKTSKRKRDESRNKRTKKDKSSKSSKNDALPLEGAKPAEKRRKAPPPEASQKPVAIIDLEQSPYREYTPSPKDLIVLSDSEEDGTQPNEQELQQLKQHLLEESAAIADEQPVSTGPKTPPEPQIKFSISTKNAIRSMNNPLMEEEEEEEGDNENEAENECTGTEMEVLHKGPNTPPESPMGPATPGSSPTSPDAYDPFEPTKSRSASPDEGAGSSDRPAVDAEVLEEPHENGTLGNEMEDDARPKLDVTDDTLVSPKKGEGEIVSPGTTAPEADESEKTKQMSPSSSAEAAAVKTPSKIVAAAGGSTEVTSSTSSTSTRPGPQRSVTQSERLLSTVIKGVSTIRPTPKPSTPAKIMPRQNGESSAQTDVVDMDLDSPYSPASSEGDDLFEPPPVYSSKPPPKTTPRPKPAANSGSKADKFDILFGSSPIQRVKYNTNSRLKPTGKNAGRNQAKLNKIVKQMAKMRKDGPGGKAEEDQIKILDEVPSSAVEMQVKDKFLKKLNRQERVVEEVKLALKPHYYKKHINKDDYKEILRRSVPKICHNKSGEINPIKIRMLVEAYVKKIRYLKKKASSASGQLKQKV